MPMKMIDAWKRPLGLSLCCAALAACSGLNARPVPPQSQQSQHGAPARAVPAAATAVTTAGEFANIARWPQVQEFIDRMVERHGFERTELQRVLSKTRHLDSVIQLVKPAPPGKPKNWNAYRARFVEPVRIDAGVRFWNDYSDKLAQAEAQYGVPAEIIVAILGVETIYGRNAGNFRVMDTLATLAFDYPDTPNRSARMAYFGGELENALLFARQSGIDPFSLIGSYAGAIGWPQFMPGSILKYAVDYDSDGRIDLRNSPADAIGSIANFLVQHGWKAGEPIVFPASVPNIGESQNWQAFLGQGLKASYRIDELKAGGVMPAIEPLPDMRYGLVDLQNGAEPTEYWLGAGNFFAITQYNRSFFYAMSVVDLSRAIRAARNH
jgi:membrane-bound lytic murein transglycosylase B